MKIISFPLGQLQANCYFLIEEDKCLIVDPGDEANFILEQLQRRKVNPLAIIATHGHFDHLMAGGEIQASFNIPLYISEKDHILLKRLCKTASYFLSYQPQLLPIKNLKPLKSGELKIAGINLEIIETPGHTPGSCSLYLKKENAVFTGDTLFKQAVGRYDFSYSCKNDLIFSLKKLLMLPEETTAYPGHGEKTIIGDELNLLDIF